MSSATRTRREFRPDPEVEADRRIRERAPAHPAINDLQHNDPRMAALAELYDRKPEPVADHWPCRVCGAQVAMTASAIATARGRAAIYNRRLDAQGEAPIVPSMVMICGKCRRKGA